MTKIFRLLVCIILAISLLLSVCACEHEAPLPPTQAPTKTPTQTPTKAPTQAPTQAPTIAPTQVPTQAPTEAPSVYVPNPGGVGEDFDYVYWYERYLIAMGAKIHWRNIPQTGNNTVNVESIEEEIDVFINLPNFEGTINFSSIDIVGDLTIYTPKARLYFGGEIIVSGTITVKCLAQSGTEFDSEEIAEVATSEELSTAIEDGGIIVMTETIVLDTSGTKITNDTTIILNGNEISSERSYNGSDTSTAA
ncbi:MAG: PT domain-containing protein, partial [Clostridia bacterium]|nr:PT domain-containing protein [Clostridia bacterium]